MASLSQYNLKSPAVKRLMKESNELRNPTEDYFAQPLEENLFDWHFTLRGPKDSPYAEGIYHGRIILPTDYPLKPPHLFLFTPNGRFQTNKKICLTISGHHPESWQPSWSIRTILLALIGFMPSPSLGTIGSLDYTTEERKELARKSINWTCDVCGSIKDLLKERNSDKSVNLKEDENAFKDLDQGMLTVIDFKGEVDQQTVSQSIKVARNNVDSDDIYPSYDHQAQNLITSNNLNNHTNSNLQSNRNPTGLLNRLLPKLIILLIALIFLKRMYTLFIQITS